MFPSDGIALSCPLPEYFQLEKLVFFRWLPGHFLPFGKLLPAIVADLIHYEVFTVFQILFVEGQVTDDNIYGIKTAVLGKH
jgi:hypothetical protein